MHQVRRQPVAIAGAAAPEHHVRRERRPRPAPFKAARVDANGTLRLGWRSENTAFYGDALNATANEKGELQYLTYDPTHGVAVEATARVAGDGVVGFALCGSDAATRADANPRGQTFFSSRPQSARTFFPRDRRARPVAEQPGPDMPDIPDRPDTRAIPDILGIRD